MHITCFVVDSDFHSLGVLLMVKELTTQPVEFHPHRLNLWWVGCIHSGSVLLLIFFKLLNVKLHQAGVLLKVCSEGQSQITAFGGCDYVGHCVSPILFVKITNPIKTDGVGVSLWVGVDFLKGTVRCNGKLVKSSPT
jgi:hypothetical protein